MPSAGHTSSHLRYVTCSVQNAAAVDSKICDAKGMYIYEFNSYQVVMYYSLQRGSLMNDHLISHLCSELTNFHIF